MPESIKIDLSIIIPCFNEEKRLHNTLTATLGYLKHKNWKVELIIADDGSQDKTNEIAREKQEIEDQILLKIVQHFPNQGRGKILTKAFFSANGRFVMYMDADLATELACLDRIFLELESAHIVIGSRLLDESLVSRSLSRTILSKTYNFLVRLFFRDGITDHKCGFKGFQRRALDLLLPQIESTGWFWDTELLVIAERKGFILKEIPIKWSERRDKGESKVKIGRTIKDYLIQLLWLRRKVNLICSGL